MRYILDSLPANITPTCAQRIILANAQRDGIPVADLTWTTTWHGHTHYTITATTEA